MFTGIVEELGTLRHVAETGSGLRLEIACERVLERLAIDDSVNVSGACLTVVGRDDRSFACDVVPETLSRTTLGRLFRGAHVNLERAATPATALGGHLVQGHVDGTTTLAARTAQGEGARLRFAMPKGLGRYVVEKGFIALDGVSLTVAGVRARAFEVAIVPHTARRTTLAALREGEAVNVEVDIIAKYVERLLGAR
jgi:riboflavin synthase